MLAETFVDPSRFRGACYRVAGWTPVGTTRGFARSGGGWVRHGRPKTVLLRPLAAHAARALAGLDEPAFWGLGPADPEPPKPERLRSLFDHLRQVPEFRSARGVRHALASVLALAAAARLAGARGPSAIAEFAARLDQRQLGAVRAFRSPTTGRLTAPSRASMHRILSGIDPGALDQAVRDFAASRHPPQGALAIDGKCAPLHRPGGANDARMCLGARRLIRELDVAGCVLTLDVLHSCPKTAQLIVAEGADYVLPVKGNRKSLLDDLKAFDADFDCAPLARTLDKAHGRLEERTCALVRSMGRATTSRPYRDAAKRCASCATGPCAHSGDSDHPFRCEGEQRFRAK